MPTTTRAGNDVELPVYRTILADEQRTHLYVSPTTGSFRIVDRDGRCARWWQDGLHALDFPGLQRRPLWDAMVLLLLAGVTVSCITGSWMAIQRIRRDSRLGRAWSCDRRTTKRSWEHEEVAIVAMVGAAGVAGRSHAARGCAKQERERRPAPVLAAKLPAGLTPEASVLDMMLEVIDPNADELWESVAYRAQQLFFITVYEAINALLDPVLRPIRRVMPGDRRDRFLAAGAHHRAHDPQDRRSTTWR